MDFKSRLIQTAGKKNYYENEPMKRHITFKAGGPAAYYVTPDNAGKIAEIIKLCKETGVRYQIIGNGSNVLFTDDGYDGVVIAVGNKMSGITVDNNVVNAGAGTKLAALAAQAAEHSLTGLEFASGIPGTVGGAIVMNAGAYGGEIKDVIISATVYDCDNDKIVILGNDELELGYRQSVLQKKEYIVLEACFELEHGDKKEINDRMKDFNDRRKSKQPLSYASAGSTFKRPEGYYAGALIEECNLKGFGVGNAKVSEKHAGFVVNTGGASADDILSVIKHVQDTVYEQKKVRLEPEVRIIK
ncbi:MAG: UDP-N-acetylmuramate dehydrogenase [Lachnospiraceae bacterium]|nr:UDP-N-acetylmuramate dehydrogenase [Lachnospiraceae bacterium]